MLIVCTLGDDISRLWSSSPKLIIQSVLMKTSSMIKKIRSLSVQGHPTECLTSTPCNNQGHQKQEKSEKLSQPRGV